MTSVAVVPARGGSKGIPGKNLVDLGGRPLIAHSIRQGLAAASVDRLIVSTDDPAIAEAARAAGAEVPFLRPAHLATDEADSIDVIEHLLAVLEAEGNRIGRVALLQPTSPLRAISDIDEAAALLDENADLVLGVTPFEANVHAVLVRALPDGGCEPVIAAPPGSVRRQDGPPVYLINGAIYWWKRDALRKPRLGPRTRVHVMPPERAVDIDTPLDLAIARCLYREP